MQLAISEAKIVELKSVFTKLKPKKKPQEERKETLEKNPQTTETPSEPPQPVEEKPTSQSIKEYHETIYTKGTAPKEKKPQKQEKTDTTWKPTHWDGINTIEKNVDTIHTKTKYQKSTPSCTDDMDIERKVDLLIKKKEK